MNTTRFFDRLTAHAIADTRPAVIGDAGALSYGDLLAATSELAALLNHSATRVVVTLLDNGPAWIVADLAALRGGVIHVPLPLFFSDEQIMGAVTAAGADALICQADLAERFSGLGFAFETELDQGSVLLRRQAQAVPIHAGTSKITFTSGSTGQPKGVCLSAQTMLSVAQSLVQATADLGLRRHLNTLPLAVLLENIAGVYAPLLAGATCISPGLIQVGLQGSSRFDPAQLHAALSRFTPQSLIVLPQMLRAYASMLKARRMRAPAGLTFVAVGGAAAGETLIQEAHALGVPAFEGYGLSEGGSVQTLNLPGAHLRGSVGRPLAHAQVRINAGEVEIAGAASLGYLGAPHQALEWFPTGDLGAIDAHGYLHIQGRKKNVLITSFGRNVSPEWVETAVRADPAILQVVVMGNDQPCLGAVIWPAREDASDAQLQAAVDAANATLPDYARIGTWLRADRDFTTATGLATANGRPRRDAVAAAFPHLFTPSSAHDRLAEDHVS